MKDLYHKIKSGLLRKERAKKAVDFAEIKQLTEYYQESIGRKLSQLLFFRLF